MPLKLIGAGYPRTGTNSLLIALEKLLDAPCYHMNTLFERPEDAPVWEAATKGQLPDWHIFLADFQAAVDWPSSLFGNPKHKLFPTHQSYCRSRKDSETWYESVIKTILPATLKCQR